MYVILNIEDTVYFMDRGFMHSSLHKLCKGVKTMLPCVRGVDELRSGLRINASDEDIVKAALAVVRKLPGKLKKLETDRLDRGEIKTVVQEVKQQMAREGFKIDDDEPGKEQYPNNGVYVYGPDELMAVNVSDDIKLDEYDHDSDDTKDSEETEPQSAKKFSYLYSHTFCKQVTHKIFESHTFT